MSAVEKIQDLSGEENLNEYIENGIVVKEKSSDKSTNDAGRSTEKCEGKRGCDNSIIDNSVARSSSFKIDESNEKRSNQSNFFAYFKRITISMWIERIILSSICVVVAAGFASPIIIYVLDANVGDNATIPVNIDVDNCPGSNTNEQVCNSSY